MLKAAILANQVIRSDQFASERSFTRGRNSEFINIIIISKALG